MNPCSQPCRVTLLLLIVAVVAISGPSADAANTVLKFETPIDDIYVRLLDNDAPGTVANFLAYVNAEDPDYSYNGSFFHRLSPGFVLQGGGFRWDYDLGEEVRVLSYDPIVNEFGRSNVRGTLAMAKLGGNPDSATNGFFFNLGDNSLNLDNQNGGFTVFAYVIGGYSMYIVDLLAGLAQESWFEIDLQDWGAPLGELPLIVYEEDLFLETLYSVSVVDATDGDADFDGDVDDDDYVQLLADFGETGPGLATDFDGDYDVDIDDFAVLRANYTAGGDSPFPAPAPEPTSICLLGLCGVALIRKRRAKS